MAMCRYFRVKKNALYMLHCTHQWKRSKC